MPSNLLRRSSLAWLSCTTSMGLTSGSIAATAVTGCSGSNRGDRDVLVFAPEEGERYSIEVDFGDGLEDRSDAELARLLDEARR